MPVLPAVPSTITPPGLSLPRLLGILDDGQRRAILDRAAGIEELGLAVDVAARRFGRGDQLDQRRVADAIDETRPDVHDMLALLARASPDRTGIVPFLPRAVCGADADRG